MEDKLLRLSMYINKVSVGFGRKEKIKRIKIHHSRGNEWWFSRIVDKCA